MSGESEKKIRDLFEEARQKAPCLMFIDEIDAVTQKRDTAQREMERRIVAQLLTCMDGIYPLPKLLRYELSPEKTDGKPVLIIGATNRPDSLDAALRRAGRFDREICMNVPDDAARERYFHRSRTDYSILKVLCKKLRLSGDFDFKKLAKLTPGYVGADLQALTAAAGVIATKRMINQLQFSGTSDQMDLDEKPRPPHEEKPKSVSMLHAFIKADKGPMTPKELEGLSITQEDFIAGIPKVQPSAKREGFATVPDVTWEDVGALAELREHLQLSIVQQISEPELYLQAGLTAPAGVLLWGPPGCGKTLLAKAVANDSRANFISVKGPELLNKVYFRFSGSNLSMSVNRSGLCDKYSSERALPPRVSSFLMNLMPWFRSGIAWSASRVFR
jgi:ribosome biogenesis ATPase